VRWPPATTCPASSVRRCLRQSAAHGRRLQRCRSHGRGIAGDRPRRSDGGDKVGDFALSDMNAYMERLAALTEDSALRKEMGESLRQRFAEHFDIEASGPALLAACRQASTLARDRLTKPS